MRRVHAFELEDQVWFPRLFRDAGTAYLRFATERSGQAEVMGELLAEVLEETGEREIVDLCSGGGGPVVAISRALRARGLEVPVTLTDLYPSASARAQLAAAPEPGLRYESEPVDATAVAPERPGLRTMFNALHHFRPETAAGVLASAVAAGRPIAIIEVLRRRLLSLALSPLILVTTLLSVPFLRPFRPAWLLFTYLLPIIPLFVWWDGTVSMLRVYDRDELLAMTREADPGGAFDWRIVEVKIPGPIPGLALIGRPHSSASPVTSD